MTFFLTFIMKRKRTKEKTKKKHFFSWNPESDLKKNKWANDKKKWVSWDLRACILYRLIYLWQTTIKKGTDLWKIKWFVDISSILFHNLFSKKGWKIKIVKIQDFDVVCLCFLRRKWKNDNHNEEVDQDFIFLIRKMDNSIATECLK